ncbi:MAG: acyl carrier protein [Gemmatimonadota bacterium]|nr:acyl carrier protein [Gemmatimonadota bacterium]
MASETKLKQVLADVFGVDVSRINDAASVDTIEKWDSLNHLKLVLALEEQFGVSLSEERIVEMLNYPLVKAVLEEHGIEFR